MPKNGHAKEYSNYRTVSLISHASKVMLKILQARLQEYMNKMEKLDLENLDFLKEISPEYSLEGLMLKLKLQFFGHLM